MPSPVSAFRASLAAAKAESGSYGDKVSKRELEKAIALLQADGKVDAFEARTAKAELNKLQLTSGARKVAAEFLAMISNVNPPRPLNDTGLAAQLPPDWRAALADEFDKPYFNELERFLEAERANHSVLPDPDRVFAALHHTPVKDVKVVLLGQDPYPTKGNANGLSFSVNEGMPVPPSLRNMFKVMNQDVGAPIPNNGNLEPWAKQGVLLINTVLTVREGAANSHKKQGWEQFTRAILDVVNKKDERVAFLLLGKQAQEVASTVDTTRHAIVNAPHPSPLAIGNPFGRTRPFSAVNDALVAAGRPPIDWTIPNR